MTGTDTSARRSSWEVYRSFEEVPAELKRNTRRIRNGLRDDQSGFRQEEIERCGLVVFWTRNGW